MKIVDILARDLKEWPEGADEIVQGHSCRLFTDKDQQLNFYPDLAEDWSGSIVTRAQWQAAVDALKIREQVEQEWSGVGLPPIGAICEVMDDDQVWHLATVKMHGVNFGKDVAIAQAKDVILWCMESHHVRPARTAEQIEHDRREAEISDLIEGFIKYRESNATSGSPVRVIIEYMQASGYRKQVQP